METEKIIQDLVDAGFIEVIEGDLTGPDKIQEMLDVLAQVQDQLARVRKESGIDEIEESITSMKKAIGEEVLANGAPVKGSVLQAIINKGRVSWDGKLLEGYAVAHPDVLPCRKEGEPTVTIRKV